MFKNCTFWICCGLAVATVAVYWPVTSADFVLFDDRDYVFENPHVLDGLSWDSITWALTTGKQSNWHPLTWWSLMLDVQLFGLSSRAMHLVNLGLHVSSTLVLFLALRQMTGAAWRSGMVAALFALHPLHVESVAWVAERKDVLSTLLGMLALWAYVCYVQGRGSRGEGAGSREQGAGSRERGAGGGEQGAGSGVWWTKVHPTVYYALVFVLLGLGLMAKPMLVTLPFVLVLLDYWPLGRFHAAAEAWQAAGQSVPAATTRSNSGRVRWKRMRVNSLRWSALRGVLQLVLEKLPLFALSAGSCWVTYYMQEKGGAMAGMQQMPFLDRFANAGVGYVSYIGKMLWPANLSVFYPLPEKPILAAGFAAWMLLAGLSVAVAIVAWRGRKVAGTLRVPSALRPQPQVVQEVSASGGWHTDQRSASVPSAGYLVVGWLWFLGTLVPVIGLVQVGDQSMADRYSYVPLVGLFIAVTWGVAELTSGWRNQRLVLCSLAGGILPGCMLLTFAEARVWANTETLFGQAIRVQGDNWHAQRIFAAWLHRQGRYEEAMEGWEKSLQYHADDPYVAYDMGVAAEEHGDKARAIACYREVIRLRPDRTDAHGLLAVLLTKTGEIGPALEQWLAVLQEAPEDFKAKNAAAWIFATCPDDHYRHGEAAVKIALEAVRLSQDRSPAVLDTLAAAYAEAGQFDKAVQTAQRALDLAALQGNKTLDESLRERMTSYQAKKPWRDARLSPAKGR